MKLINKRNTLSAAKSKLQDLKLLIYEAEIVETQQYEEFQLSDILYSYKPPQNFIKFIWSFHHWSMTACWNIRQLRIR